MGDSSFCFLPFQRSIVLIWTVSRSLYTFNYCKSQRFCLCRLYWPIFTIKTKKLKYCLLIHLKTMINSYVIKNILKIKNSQEEWHCFTFLYISFISGFTKDSWILISAYAFNQLYYMSWRLWKSLLYIQENENEKGKYCLCIIIKIVLISKDSPENGPDQTLRTSTLGDGS